MCACAFPKRSAGGLLQGNPDLAVVVGVPNILAGIDLQLRPIGVLPARGREPLVEDALKHSLDRLGKRSARLKDAPGRGRRWDVAAAGRQGRAIGRGLDGDEVTELPTRHVELGTYPGDADGAPPWYERL